MRPKRHWRVADSPRGMLIVRFLRRAPIPDKVVARDDLEGEKTIMVRTKNGNVKWTDVSNACFACSHLIAQDAEGNVLRELPLDPNDPELDGPPELATQKIQAREDAKLPGREPIISVDVPALVRSIADAMKDVAKSAAEQNAAAHQTGMEAMSSVVALCLNIMQRVDQRLAAVEDAADELAEQRRDLITTGEGQDEPTGRDQLIALALQNAMGQPATNGEAAAEGSEDAVDPVRAKELVELINAYAASKRGNPPAEG